MLPHAKLPDKARLERLYVEEGLSFREIGERYGVPAKTVYNCMVRRSRKAGTPWPLKQGQPGWGRRMGRKRWDSVTAVMVRAEILLCVERYGVTQLDIDRLAGLNHNACQRITCRGPSASKRISRMTAQKIMGAIEAIEKGAR